MSTSLGKVRTLAAAAVVAGIIASPTATAQTTFEYLQGGNIEQVKFVDQDNGFLVADGGRIHYSTNGGLDWQEADTVDDDFEAWGNLHGLFFQGTHGEIGFRGWAVGDGGVILKTADFTGAAWEYHNKNARITSNLETTRITCGEELALLRDVFMIDGDIGWAVGDDGTLVKTVNDWQSWTQVSGLASAFVCNNDPLDIYQIHFFPEHASDSNYVPYSKGVIVSEYGRIYRTDDAGLTWLDEPVHGAPDPMHPDPNDPSGCIVAQTYPDNPPDNPPLVLGGLSNGTNLELWEIAFEDPDDADTAMTVVGGVGNSEGYIFRRQSGWSTPTCEAWSQEYDYKFVNAGATSHVTVCGLSTLYTADMIDPASTTVAVAGYAGGLYFRNNFELPNFDVTSCAACPPGSCSSGVTWVQQDTVAEVSPGVPAAPPFGHNAALLAGARVSDDVGVFAGHFGVITRYDTSGGPPTVEEVGTPWVLRLTDGEFTSATTGVVVGQQGMILRTTDGGANWTSPTVSWTVPTATSNNADVAYLRAVSFSGVGGHVVAVGTEHIAISDDDGATWTEPAPSGLPSWIPDLTDVSYVPGTQTVYACGGAGRVFKSTDDGATWSDVRIRTAGARTINAVSFATTQRGYAVTSDALVYETMNGGISWSQVNVAGPETPTFTDVVTWGDGTQAVVVGHSGSIYERSGSSFVQQTPGSLVVEEHLLDVEQFQNGGVLRISGNNGVVLFRDNGVWTQPRSRTTQALPRLSFLSADEGFGIGTRSLIIKYDDT